MELGQKIKALRLEKGLSQRQICGEFMTRNMLSLIENGAAKPSMDTLRYLAARLETPVSYFLEEQVVTSPNERLMGDARAALALGNLDGLRQALDGFREPDAVFWEERQLLEFYWHLQQGAGALAQARLPYACTLLERALALPGLYITKALRQRARVLLTLAGGEGHPDNEDTALLALAMEETDPRRQAAILEAAEDQESAQWNRAMAKARMGLGEYGKALEALQKCPESRETLQAVEICCRELGDFKGAYEAACKLR